MSMFEKASRLKLRWNIRGNSTVEDLWTIPLNELEAQYDELSTAMESRQRRSLLVETVTEDEILTLKIEIIKHVVLTRLEEKKKAEETRANAAYRQRLASIIDNKKDQVLLDKSIEELENMLKETK